MHTKHLRITLSHVRYIQNNDIRHCAIINIIITTTYPQILFFTTIHDFMSNVQLILIELTDLVDMTNAHIPYERMSGKVNETKYCEFCGSCKLSFFFLLIFIFYVSKYMRAYVSKARPPYQFLTHLHHCEFRIFRA